MVMWPHNVFKIWHYIKNNLKIGSICMCPSILKVLRRVRKKTNRIKQSFFIHIPWDGYFNLNQIDQLEILSERKGTHLNWNSVDFDPSVTLDLFTLNIITKNRWTTIGLGLFPFEIDVGSVMVNNSWLAWWMRLIWKVGIIHYNGVIDFGVHQ